MSYTKHDFQSGDILMASDLNEMDDQIAALTQNAESGGSYTIKEETSGVEIVINTQNSAI